MKNSGGTGFWHETYMMAGGMEAIYDDMSLPVGFLKFAPVIPARGPMFAAATRAHKAGSADSVLSESDLYDK